MEAVHLDKIREYAVINSSPADPIFGNMATTYLQVAVYVMCGGGLLGHFAAEQPADFYIDDRVGRLPYPRKEIYQAVSVLKTLAEAHCLDPHKMPELPSFHACGIF